jgi:hypothetical protein
MTHKATPVKIELVGENNTNPRLEPTEPPALRPGLPRSFPPGDHGARPIATQVGFLRQRSLYYGRPVSQGSAISGSIAELI